MTKTFVVLEYAIGKGILLGNPEEIEKKIPHKIKMVLLRFWNDFQEMKTKFYEDKLDTILWKIKNMLEK